MDLVYKFNLSNMFGLVQPIDTSNGGDISFWNGVKVGDEAEEGHVYYCTS